MLWLYRLLFLPALIVLAPHYLWRMRRRGGYGERFSQRFGSHHQLPAPRAGVSRVWLQAVSVGEILAIDPVIEALTSDGTVEVYLTTTTSTGYRLAQERLAKRVIGIGYFPIDWWLFSRRAWRAVSPDLVILTEGERWPEHIHQANQRGVPVIGINARLSDRSYRRMRRFRFTSKAVLGGITRLLPCSKQDEARFLELGFPREKLVTTGNIKLDLRIQRLDQTERKQLRAELGLAEGPVLLGSSTWPGEEAALLVAWREARRTGIACSLLIVPRHAERRGEIEQLMVKEAVSFHFRSRGAAPTVVDVAIADTTGELRKLTQLADLIFIGKSLPPNEGGQTPVEAAALEKPILFGPSMSNFRAIAAELLAAGAAHEVADAAGLQREVARLFADDIRRGAMAVAGGRWHRSNAGAVERTVRVVREELDRLRSGTREDRPE
ncbi:MAG TPA: glycosyltransferase N-terminal domain-containing protein [Opitutus sp.]|nr:glycosyltransferase N-terminal domain-containing protein [Opitutus sp.]